MRIPLREQVHSRGNNFSSLTVEAIFFHLNWYNAYSLWNYSGVDDSYLVESSARCGQERLKKVADWRKEKSSRLQNEIQERWYTPHALHCELEYLLYRIIFLYCDQMILRLYLLLNCILRSCDLFLGTHVWRVISPFIIVDGDKHLISHNTNNRSSKVWVMRIKRFIKQS